MATNETIFLELLYVNENKLIIVMILTVWGQRIVKSVDFCPIQN